MNAVLWVTFFRVSLTVWQMAVMRYSPKVSLLIPAHILASGL